MSKAAFINTSFGFNIEGSAPDVKRQQFDTIADMRACTNAPEGYVTYCLANRKRYEFHKSNDFLQGSTGYWREYTATVDLSDYATKAYVDRKTNKREVMPATASYIAAPPHKNDMDILYVVPVEGETYFNEYIATRERKPQTIPVIEGEPTPLDSDKIYAAEEFDDPDLIVALGMEAIILDVKDGVCGFYHSGSESEDARYPNDYDWAPCQVGDRFWDNSGQCWVAGSDSEWHNEDDEYIYSWLAIGTTEYDVSGKQDALTADGGVLTAMIDGVPYAINAEMIAAPSIAVISPNVAQHDGKVLIQMSCNTPGAVIHYTYTIDGSDPDDPTTASPTYSTGINIGADNTQQSITVKVKAIAVKYGRMSETIASKTYTIFRICDKPTFGVVSGTQFDATRSVTLSMIGKTPNDATLKYSFNNGASWSDYNGESIPITTSPTKVVAKATKELWKDSPINNSLTAIVVGQLKMYYGSIASEPLNWDDADVEQLTADASVFNGEFARSFSKAQSGATGERYYAVVAYPKKTKTGNGDSTNKELVYASEGVINAISAFTHIETTNYHVYYAPLEATTTTITFADSEK